MKDLEKQIEEAMQGVAIADGYSNFYDINTELHSEYTKRAYWKVMQRMYSEREVCNLLLAFRRDVLPHGQISDFELNNWFEQNKKTEK